MDQICLRIFKIRSNHLQLNHLPHFILQVWRIIMFNKLILINSQHHFNIQHHFKLTSNSNITNLNIHHQTISTQKVCHFHFNWVLVMRPQNILIMLFPIPKRLWNHKYNLHTLEGVLLCHCPPPQKSRKGVLLF